MRTRARALAAALAALAAVLLASTTACSPSGALSAVTASSGTITAVGAESEYSSVISQVGGRYVSTSSVMSNPNTDPHTFEASIAVARQVTNARLVVQNGLGYDDWATTMENADPGSSRTVINVQKLLGLPDSTPDPHLWYSPATMPKVAGAVAAALSRIAPSRARYFRANAAKFTARLSAWTRALAAFRAAHPRLPVATTEPVADYLLQAAGADNRTPWAFQDDIMNGNDPSPQLTAAENALFTQHKVKVFLYNEQVTDSLTDSYIQLANKHHIPVVGVYETLPAGYTYQAWMEAEVHALNKAVTDHTSTQKL